jgi:hypothetical protein
VEGVTHGRAGLVDQVRAGFDEADAFSTDVLALEARGDRAIAVVHNRGRRGDAVLDSQQALLFRVRDGAVAGVRVVVDDPASVEAFWDEE